MFSKFCCNSKDGDSPVKKSKKAGVVDMPAAKGIKIVPIISQSSEAATPSKEESKAEMNGLANMNGDAKTNQTADGSPVQFPTSARQQENNDKEEKELLVQNTSRSELKIMDGVKEEQGKKQEEDKKLSQQSNVPTLPLINEAKKGGGKGRH